MKEDNSNNNSNHIKQTLTEEYAHVIEALEKLETKERIKFFPTLVHKAPALEFDDILQAAGENEEDSSLSQQHQNVLEENQYRVVSIADNGLKYNGQKVALISGDGTAASLRRFNLRTFSISMIAPPTTIINGNFLEQLTTLDLSNNELMDIPGLSKLCNLQTLNLERGWFNTLPTEIGSLKALQVLIASRNFLRPNSKSLQLEKLKLLSNLQMIDLTYNQKCGTKQHHEFIQSNLPQVHEIKVTLWEEVGSIPGSYVGSCASERDPNLLRSQLEPWGTPQLRKRLVQDFNQLPTDGSKVDRAGVMERLLMCYQKEGLMEQNTGNAIRRRVHVHGTPVSQDLIDELLVELRSWTNETGLDNKNRERPSIDARNYIILRKPKLNIRQDGNSIDNGEAKLSRRAMRKARKMNKYMNLWDLAMKAIQQVNPDFANQCTEIAVTFGFRGSPHIDKQNSGPFYGLSLGNFQDGQGGVCVECSARIIAVVNTKNRLGRIDGRYPHWVDSYDQQSSRGINFERYSLIYYETGGIFKQPGPAVFDIPN